MVFLIAPFISAALALMAWAVIPINAGWALANINVGILYIFAISSLEVYGVLMGGWASNSKYPFLGAVRSAAQMISYEVSIGFVIATVLLLSNSLNLTDIVSSKFWIRAKSWFFCFFIFRLELAAVISFINYIFHIFFG